MSFSLQDKVAFITGGANGIGLAVAKRYREAGAKVMIVDVEDGSTIADEIGASFMFVDVANEEQIMDALAKTEAEMGKVDILINNAANKVEKWLIEEAETAGARRVVDVNFFGTYFGLKHGPRHMNDGGSIINTSSQVALSAAPGFEPYAATKAAIGSLTRTAAIELGSRDIRVNAVCPGNVRTRDNDPPDLLRIGILMTQLGRRAETDDMVGLYHFLGSDESAYISGLEIPVDAGFLAGTSIALIDELTNRYSESE